MPDESIRLVDASGECEIDLARRELRVLGSPVPVGGRAFEIIEILARSAGELVTKNELTDRIWPGLIVGENTLHVHAGAIRKALGPYRHLLKTISGRGYRLLGNWSVRRQNASKPPVGVQRIALTGENSVTNFPATVTRLVGRIAAVAQLRDRLSAYRLVTVTGPGGIGKTSIALKAARGILGDFPNGGWLVELASLSDPELVPSVVAQVLGIRTGGETITAEIIARTASGRQLLLVLDNCEHLIDAVANLADILMRRCPRITILATSRESLRIDGEAVFRLPPLEVPTPDQRRPEDILGHSAVELFVTRAAELDFSAATEALSEIVGICRHLDGIPLAIEFAAARVATLGVSSVAAGLRDRFALLTGGRRTAPPRHRTLRATLDWSYQLLSAEERTLLRRLAVFSGGFTMDAAIAVNWGAGADTVDGVSSLVGKSLISIDGSTAGRWRLLETIRVYALEKLIEAGEADRAARLHATWFLDFSNSIPTGVGAWALTNVAPHACEIDNVRSALDWSFGMAGDVATGVALTAAYVPIWLHSALWGECGERCDRALFHLDQQPAANVRLRLRLQFAFMRAAIYALRPVDQIRTVFASTLDIAQSLNDLNAELMASYALWGLHYWTGEPHAAFRLAERMSACASSVVGEPYFPNVVDRLIGLTLHHQGDQRGAHALLERVAERSATSATRQESSLYWPDQPVLVHVSLSRVLLLRGYLDQAAEQARISLEKAMATGDDAVVCHALWMAVCPVALMLGNLVEAEREIARLADIADALNAPIWISAGRCFEGKLLIAQGAFEAGSALLRSELDACERTGWTSWYPEFLGVYAEGLAGLGRFSDAVASLDQALAKAAQGGERYYVAELLQLKGKFLLAQSGEHTAAIDDCYHSALRTAQDQGALLFELRAAMAAARWRMLGDRAVDARRLLAPVYGQFAEGFGTADLRAAKAFLDELPA